MTVAATPMARKEVRNLGDALGRAGGSPGKTVKKLGKLWETYGTKRENIMETYGKNLENYGKHMETYGKKRNNRKHMGSRWNPGTYGKKTWKD